MIDFLRLAVLIVALVIWSVVGFVFWIPFLIRQIAVFSALILHAARKTRNGSLRVSGDAGDRRMNGERATARVQIDLARDSGVLARSADRVSKSPVGDTSGGRSDDFASRAATP